MKNVRVTKGGMVILAVLAVAVVISLVATGGVRFIAAGVAALILLLLVGEGVGGRGGVNTARKGEVLRGQARKRRFDDAP